MMKRYLAVAVLLCFACAARGEEQQSESPLGKLASLVGTWQGENDMKNDGHMVPFTITYKLTAGQSALVETLMAGTPHEMVTIYTRDKGDFVATHYCMLRNQPRMRAKDTLADQKLNFEFVDATGLASPNDPHMHALAVEFTDADHITQTWSHFDGGKEVRKVVFHLTRQK
jgi:hypothetical protein